MVHQRFRRFNTGSYYPEQKITNDACKSRGLGKNKSKGLNGFLPASPKRLARRSPHFVSANSWIEDPTDNLAIH